MTQPPPPTGPHGYPESSQATTSLVLGILGLFCAVTAPFAWYIGNKEVAAIDQGLRDPTNRGQAVAGRVLGIIGTVFVMIWLLAVCGLVAVQLAGNEVSETFSEIGSSLD